jgi:hypothetical protein
MSLPRAAAALLVALLAAPLAPVHAQNVPLPRPRPMPGVVVPSTITTTFDPRTDGLPFVNDGDYTSAGNCWGMSLLAIDNYLRRLDAGAPRPLSTSGIIGQQTASLTQDRLTRLPEDPTNPPVPLSDTSSIARGLNRIARTGLPEVLTFDDGDDGHAVVLYGYRDGKLQIYDPNFPGETIEWPWDPVTGFGRHPKAGLDGARGRADFYGNLTEASSTPFEQHPTAAQLGAIRAACEQGQKVCTARFMTVDAAVKPSPDGRTVTITGRVRGGLRTNAEGEKTPPAHDVWIGVGDDIVASARLRKDGTFRLTLPASALAGGPAQVVATTKDGVLAGATTLPAATPRPRSRGLSGITDDTFQGR